MRSHHLRAAGGGGSSLPIEENGLDIYLDANDPNSYSGSGTTWTNLATSGTFGNAALYTSGNYSAFSSSGTPKYFANLAGHIPFTSRNYYRPFTYSVWCYPTAWGSFMVMIDQGGFRYSFEINGQTIGMWEPNNGAARYHAWTNGTLNTWWNLTLTYEITGSPNSNSNAWKIYVNGSLFQSVTDGDNSTGTFSDFNFGASYASSVSAGSYPFQGNIAAYLVYNRVLSATEISDNFNAMKATYGY
tara:strand:+ start:297 stop:1028 length:732 start_codon:yes stop_codon:yes gene_type:complete